MTRRDSIQSAFDEALDYIDQLEADKDALESDNESLNEQVKGLEDEIRELRDEIRDRSYEHMGEDR